MPARGTAPATRLSRYVRRFGGTGTIVTLEGGRALTAAHCLAAADGRPGTVIAGERGRWRVLRRWSPRRIDLVVLMRLDASAWPPLESRSRRQAFQGTHGQRGPSPRGPRGRLASRGEVRRGVEVTFVGHTGRRFQRRRAVVTTVSAATALATVLHPRGVCGNDSGGPVFVGDRLVGVVTHRMGMPISSRGSSRCSSQVVFTRLDSPLMRAKIAAAFERAVRTTRRL